MHSWFGLLKSSFLRRLQYRFPNPLWRRDAVDSYLRSSRSGYDNRSVSEKESDKAEFRLHRFHFFQEDFFRLFKEGSFFKYYAAIGDGKFEKEESPHDSHSP
jgi:hypothetical protein